VLDEVKRGSIDLAIGRDVAALAAAEATGRLELLAAVSHALDRAPDDAQELARRAVEACVPAFADLCAVELAPPHGHARTAAFRVSAGTGLKVPKRWVPLGARLAGGEQLLLFPGNEPDGAMAKVRSDLGAESLLVVPITRRGAVAGWFVAATGPGRRAFRPSGLRVAAEVTGRLAAALERAALRQDMKRAERALLKAEHLQAMGLLAGRVAHDFNNLLTVILGYADFLGCSPGEEASQLAVANIARAAGRAAALTHQLLGVAVENPDRASNVDLAALLREMVPAVELEPAQGQSSGFEAVADPPHGL
jgi:GAF domain-containing protein